MATGVKTTINVGKIMNSLIRARAAAFQELTQDITVRKQRVIDVIKEKYGVASNTQLGQKLRVLKEYWKVEMAPPSPGELRQIKSDINVIRGFISSGAWKHLTVKQAWLLFLVAMEVGLWFYLGETFGKMSFVGYKV